MNMKLQILMLALEVTWHVWCSSLINVTKWDSVQWREWLKQRCPQMWGMKFRGLTTIKRGVFWWGRISIDLPFQHLPTFYTRVLQAIFSISKMSSSRASRLMQCNSHNLMWTQNQSSYQWKICFCKTGTQSLWKKQAKLLKSCKNRSDAW